MRLALRNRYKIIKELGTAFCARLILAVADYEKNNEDVSINGRIRLKYGQEYDLVKIADREDRSKRHVFAIVNKVFDVYTLAYVKTI